MFEQKEAYINGIKLNYYECGKGEPILFLHGAFVNALTFKLEIEKLSENFRVIAPDIPCFGDSGIPNKIWNFTDFANFFDEFAKYLNLEKFYAIGHSFGGGIALHLGLKNKNLEKIVLASSAGVQIKDTKLKFMLNFYATKLTKESRSTTKEVVKKQLQGIKSTLKNHSKNTIKVGKIIMESLTQETPDFNNLNIPVLIQSGDKDDVISVEYAKELHKLIKNSELKVYPGNHSWCMIESEIFCRNSLEFLQK